MGDRGVFIFQKVIYCNYGTREDFEDLAARGVDVRGAIVIAR